MKKYFNSVRLKIIVSIVIAFFLTTFLSNNIFLVNTPRVNSLFVTKLKELSADIVFMSSNFVASLMGKAILTVKQQEVLKELEKLPAESLNKIGTGVYAKDDIENNLVYIRVTENAEFEEKMSILNGKETRIAFPKGTFE